MTASQMSVRSSITPVQNHPRAERPSTADKAALRQYLITAGVPPAQAHLLAREADDVDRLTIAQGILAYCRKS